MVANLYVGINTNKHLRHSQAKRLTSIVPKAYKCIMSDRFKIFFVHDHPRCKKAEQLKQAAAFGVDETRTWIIGTKRGEQSIENFTRAVNHGDHIGIAYLWLFPRTGQGVRPRPQKQLREIVDCLLSKGCKLTETATGRSCTSTADVVCMYADAVDFLSFKRLNQKAGKGAPKVHIYTQAQAQVIADIWNRRDLTNSAERIAAIRKRDPAFKRFTETAWYRDVKPMLKL